MPVVLGMWAAIRELLACHLLRLISRRIGETEPELKYLKARMAELADALDLGSSTARCAGSTPVPGTMFSPPPRLLLLLT